MPNEADTPVTQRIFGAITRGRLALAVAGVAVLTIAALAAASARSAAGDADPPPAAAVATIAPGDASVLRSFDLTPRFDPRDGETLAAIARYAEIASRPTATPEPPIATPVPDTPTPRPQPSPTRAAPVLPPPTSTPEAGPPPQAPPAAAPSGLDTSPMDAYAQELFDDTNRRRVESGLPPLRANGYLVGIARLRSQDMADYNYFAHISPVTGDGAFSLMDKYGVPYGWAGENLAKNNYALNECVSVADAALWNSAPHRENILNPNYTDMGIALVSDASGMRYFTIIFTGPG